eukprot:SAG11_NODE_2078_length_3855_cov_2.006124_4_plen_168_part_00
MSWRKDLREKISCAGLFDDPNLLHHDKRVGACALASTSVVASVCLMEGRRITEPPITTGPFDAAVSPGTMGTGYTLGGTAYYRKHFNLSGAPDLLRWHGTALHVCVLTASLLPRGARAVSSNQRVFIRFDGVCALCQRHLFAREHACFSKGFVSHRCSAILSIISQT